MRKFTILAVLTLLALFGTVVPMAASQSSTDDRTAQATTPATPSNAPLMVKGCHRKFCP